MALLGVSGGHAPVDYGTNLANSEEDPNTIPDGTEYTALTNLEPMTSVVKEMRMIGISQRVTAAILLVMFAHLIKQLKAWGTHTNGGDNGKYSYLVPGLKIIP